MDDKVSYYGFSFIHKPIVEEPTYFNVRMGKLPRGAKQLVFPLHGPKVVVDACKPDLDVVIQFISMQTNATRFIAEYRYYLIDNCLYRLWERRSQGRIQKAFQIKRNKRMIQFITPYDMTDEIRAYLEKYMM